MTKEESEQNAPLKTTCQETHMHCKTPSTESYCSKETGHSGNHKCKECGREFS